MSYCWFSRETLLKNAWDKYHSKRGKQKTAKYYGASNKYRNFSEKKMNKKGNIKGKDTA